MQVTAEKDRDEMHGFGFQVLFLTFLHFCYKAPLMSVFEGTYKVPNSVAHSNRHAGQSKQNCIFAFRVYINVKDN